MDKNTDLQNKLLRNWLSIAESQICSLEVICTQLPKMNTLLEENIESIGVSFSTLASHAQSQSCNIDNILKAATTIKINSEEKKLVEALKALKHSTDTKQLDKLIDAAEQQQVILNGAVEMSKVSSGQMVTAVSHAIVGMQFQDRVSQNLVIAENVAKENIKHLKENIDNTISQQSHCIDGDKAELDIDFAKRLIGLLTLGELQHLFVDYLMAHNYIKDPATLGFGEDAQASNNNDDMELF